MSAKPTVLILEDEPDIRDLVSLHLFRAGYQVIEAGNVAEAEAKVAEALRSSSGIDIAIVDWMLPGESGIQFVERLRSHSPSFRLSVLMLTAKGEPEDIVRGLEAGADDYVVKPFEAAVLLARVKALLRRKQAGTLPSSPKGRTSSSPQIEFGKLVIRPESYEVKLDGALLSLTPSEFKLLLALAENRGKVLTRERLIALVQGEGISVIDRAVDTHIFGLRKKLGPAADLIETVRGVGYRIRWDDA